MADFLLSDPSSQSSTMKQMVMDGNLPVLPDDIIANILKRLTVKSLIRFQCVCKHWKNLIKTPSFVQDHLHHSRLQNPSLLFQNPYVCFGRVFILSSQTTPITREIKTPSFLYLLDCEMQVREVQDIPFYSARPRIIGSSHGLLCVATPYSISLWNPAIREVRTVPIGAIKEFEGDYHLGFGFSSIVNDFKLVKFSVSDSDDLVKQVEVYSLSTRSWKEIDFDFEGKIRCFETVTANGVIFWRVLKIGLVEDVYLILSFDIAKEVFTWMPLPDLDFYSSPKLTVYDNKLALLSHAITGDIGPPSSLIDLWVMEEGTSASGGRWNWTKKHAIVSSPGMLLLPFSIWRNDIVCNVSEVLVKDIRRITVLSLLNLHTHEIKKFAVPKCGNSDSVVFNHVESLVSVGDVHIEEPDECSADFGGNEDMTV